LTELETAIEIRPHFESCEEALGTAYEAAGKDAEALSHWRKAHLIDPGRSSAMLGIAWLLATAPESSLRNGPEAVRMAESARDSEPNSAEVLDTLAAAYAEEGQFSRALGTADRAKVLAQAEGKKQLADDVRARRLLYAKNMPFHSAKTPTSLHRATGSAPEPRQSQ